MNRILALLAVIASFAAAISWGGKQKAKAESAQKDADTLKLQRVARDKANDAMGAGLASQEAAIKEVKDDKSTKRDHFTDSNY